ncbi:carboxylesterase [Xaviernesmea oryzae]|uniref:Carboxylesterase n=1 Tax=Xaviernesmea oryzae TaxID=464029 RepID=A0A1Q9AZV7_9HYPH|nr:alpha/beta hydrolase [Xaviernesmea oryzae]OLP61256.1 carboxylesterase [Xaviernesmea oryzae]SEL52346.1 acetyl esterase [Xaviernesmea oryzae]
MAPSPSPTEPEILAFQAQSDSFYPPDAVSAPISEQRRFYDALCARFDQPSPVGLVREEGQVGPVQIRRYGPARQLGPALIFYLHGGGFVVGSLQSHDAICAELSDHTGREVVALAYRLAPEHVWPAAFEDGRAVLDNLLGEGRPLVLTGDSAGGNLAAGLAIDARDRGLQGICGQALIYPGLGGDLVSGSYAEMAEAPGLTTADVRHYRDVLQAPDDLPIAMPLKVESTAGLPPAYITAAHFDPLRDDARTYAARLALSGVAVTFREEPQMVHAWLRARHMSPGARAGFEALCKGIQALCALGEGGV